MVHVMRMYAASGSKARIRANLRDLTIFNWSRHGHPGLCINIRKVSLHRLNACLRLLEVSRMPRYCVCQIVICGISRAASLVSYDWPTLNVVPGTSDYYDYHPTIYSIEEILVLQSTGCSRIRVLVPPHRRRSCNNSSSEWAYAMQHCDCMVTSICRERAILFDDGW